ncbi:MAG: hypothetical protein N2C14_18840, partial [Planctomycetales bacterium]
DRVILPTEDVEQMKESKTSMMPEGQFDKMSMEEIRDLISYLATKSQVPLPPVSEQPAPPSDK